MSIRFQNCQQWNDCLPSVPSTVLECLPPAPNNIVGAVAGDDFVGKYTGAVNTIEWWGTVSHPNQRYRRYQITIYRNNGNCQPYLQQPVYSACVNPLYVQPVGVDCQGNRVWKFTAVLSTPFNQTAGVRYWLSIAEVDAFSVRQGVADFWWSGHRACGDSQCGCSALLASLDVAGQPRFDPVISRCDGQPMDLAWCLGWKSWWKAQLADFDFPPHSALRYSISIPGGAVIEEGSAEIEEIIHEDGTRELIAPISTEIPGVVEIKIWPPNSLPRVYEWDTENSLTERTVSPILGDVNIDGTIDDADLLLVLFNFGSGG